MKQLTYFTVILTFLTCFSLKAQEIAILKYNGGGDWYANPTALPNLITFCNQQLNTTIKTKPQTVEVNSIDLFQYPFVHMTGHGNVVFSESDVENLRTYLLSGGFLHIDDNYGMAPYLKKEISKLFPNEQLEELSAEHPIFNQTFKFPEGLPKIHEHDGKRPQAFGITKNNRLVLLFTFETDLGDGWEDTAVHNDPENVREKALQMGANIIEHAFKD